MVCFCGTTERLQVVENIFLKTLNNLNFYGKDGHHPDPLFFRLCPSLDTYDSGVENPSNLLWEK